MQEQIFIDTGFVVALVDPGDEYHQQALKFSYILETAYLIITDAILLEIGNRLSRPRHRQGAIQIIEAFIEAENVEIVEFTPELFNKAFKTYKKYDDKKWGLVDCLSFVVMWDRGITKVLGFDSTDFKQAGFTILTNTTE